MIYYFENVFEQSLTNKEDINDLVYIAKRWFKSFENEKILPDNHLSATFKNFLLIFFNSFILLTLKASFNDLSTRFYFLFKKFNRGVEIKYLT